MVIRVFALALGISTCAVPAFADRAVAVFTLRDYLRRDWQHELVFFPVAEKVFGRDDLMLVGPNETPVVYQWVPAKQAPSGKDSVAFCGGVSEFGESTYRLVEGRPARATDLRITEGSGSARLENRLIGIELGGPAALAGGPIAGVRLPGGRWVGGGRLETRLAAERCLVELTARGPVFADVLVSYQFPKSRFWRLKFRLIAGEPVVLIDEEFSLPEGSAYTFRPGKGWKPEEVFYRDNGNTCRLARIDAIPGDTAFLLRAWPTWWGETPEAHWTALCESRGEDVLMIGCREPGAWVEPERTAWDTAVGISKPNLEARFQLRGVRRKWMLSVLRKSDMLGDEGKRVAPLPQQYLIRHGDVPLDSVKDYRLEWDDRATRHPGLFLTEAELTQFRKRFQVDEETLARLRTTKVPPYGMDQHVAHYLATGDVQLGRNLAATALELVQGAVDGLVRQDELRHQGTCPHHRTRPVMGSAILSDLALAPGVLTPPQRTRLKAQLAFLGYTLASPTFHSPERGYAANPNMTTSARGMLGLVACCIPNHPRAAGWARLGVEEIDRELRTWCGPNGGWLEAPHYMTVSMDAIVPLSMALRGTGFTETEWLYHPKLKKTLAWLAKVSTPPDSRLGGDRHMPAIGNTYLGERSCLPGWAAWIWRQRDPRFAENMQWVWKAHGSPTTPGIGGAYPGLQGYRSVVLDATIPPAPPRWGSELFPEAGAVLRAHFPGNRETYLHYVQGKMHQHYDYDEGSFILWGKGQPLCEDFGYYGRAPAADHSRVDDGLPEHLGSEGQIREFAAGNVDYLRGQRAGWHRQILFVKDDDPLGPNYFAIRDHVLSGRQADWRVWIAADEPLVTDINPLRAKGRFEADLAVFFADPSNPQLRSTQITRRCGASGFADNESTQRCLHLNLPSDQPVAAVLYPLMKDQPTPKFSSLAGGRVVKIESRWGTDYVMLALEDFRFSHDGIEFEGKAGAVQVRPSRVQLSLPRRGKLSYRGKALENTGTAAQTVSKQFGP